MSSSRALKQVDLLRHELKALRYILENFHSGKIAPTELPPAEDFMSAQGRQIYGVIVGAASRASAESELLRLDLEDVDIGSFLRLSGGHYYGYPDLVRQRAAAIRSGALKVEAA
ncbi:MAG TPA: hypothetical protein VMD75_08685 [Candidatus Binataceae bacterium]|nr:hypothetical protein [Candidatus Binataceae bacterium]